VPTWDALLARIGPSISGLLGRIYQYTFTAMEGVVLLILLLMMVIYSLARPEPLVAGLLGAVPERGRARAEEILSIVLQRMKSWAIGTVELAGILAVLSGVGLHFLGVPYALVFAIIAGIGELIPTIGPLVTAIPPLLTALAIDPMLAVWVGVLYLALHQLENHLLVPLVMGRAVDMHPLSVTFVVLVMATLFGLLGIIIAVPAALVIKTLYQELYLSRQVRSEEALRARSERVITESEPPVEMEAGAINHRQAA
jgi:putative permease